MYAHLYISKQIQMNNYLAVNRNSYTSFIITQLCILNTIIKILMSKLKKTVVYCDRQTDRYILLTRKHDENINTSLDSHCSLDILPVQTSSHPSLTC